MRFKFFLAKKDMKKRMEPNGPIRKAFGQSYLLDASNNHERDQQRKQHE